MTSNRMPGRVSPPWCPVCKAPPGPDCFDIGKTPRQVRRIEEREVSQEIEEELDNND